MGTEGSLNGVGVGGDTFLSLTPLQCETCRRTEQEAGEGRGGRSSAQGQGEERGSGRRGWFCAQSDWRGSRSARSHWRISRAAMRHWPHGGHSVWRRPES